MWVVLTKKWTKYGRGPKIKKQEFKRKKDAYQHYQDLLSLGELPEIYQSEQMK